uniref:receptor protein-tyrosine kinase n=1 Tax=Parastrongyloides trichosuri TaxID=131310 RepID=A0A0N4Z133_PARTI
MLILNFSSTYSHQNNSRTMVLLIMFILTSLVNGLELRECNKALGMENGRIKDTQITSSSSYDEQSTGPQNSRIRTESGAGAWCPMSQINMTSNEWIEIDFSSNMVITAIETQGRFGGGEGQEYTPMFKIKYKREGMGPWASYKDSSNNEFIKANTDTRTSVLIPLDGSIIASRIRLYPLSPKTRTVCLRLELHGCRYNGVLDGYTITNGGIIDGLEMRDFKFDGTTNDTIKTKGFGKLYDGKIGEDNFDDKPNHWIGWKNEDVKGKVSMKFYFKDKQNLTGINFYTNNFFKHKSLIFKKAIIKLSSTGDEGAYSKRSVEFSYEPDLIYSNSRWIRIPIPSRIAKLVKVDLYLPSKADFLLISEVKFETNLILLDTDIDDLGLENEKDDFISLDGSKNSLTFFAINEVPDTVTNYILIIVIIFISASLLICSSLIYVMFFCRKDRQPKNTLLPIFRRQNVQMIMKDNSETVKRCYKSGTLLEGKNIISDNGSDYADPDYSVCVEQPLLNKMYYSTEGTTYNVFSQGTLTSNLSNTSSTISSPITGYRNCKEIEEFLIDMDHIVKINPSALVYVEKLGNGEFGPINLCQLEHRLVASKKLKQNASKEELINFKKEILIMSALKHQNILEVIGISFEQPNNTICCIMEYMKNGDLCQYLQSQNYNTLTTEFLLSIATQIAAGMSYLESKNFVHRDLAARNCFVDEDGIVKIGNFGMARSLYSSDYYTVQGKMNAPIRWMAWESLLLGRFTTKSDVWHFGVTLWEILMGGYDKPYAKLTDDEVVKNLECMYNTGRLNTYLPRPRHGNSLLYDDLMLKCWQREEHNRPTFTSIHCFLQNMTCNHARGSPNN